MDIQKHSDHPKPFDAGILMISNQHLVKLQHHR